MAHPDRPEHGTSALSRLALLLAVSVLAGVLTAGLAFPLVGGLGLAAKSGADSFDNLPSELTTPPLPQRSRVLAADGSVLATIFLNENRVVVPLARIPAVMRQAIVAVEDARFYTHNGVDMQGLLRAAVENSQAGEVRQGGSTLTQQYVKNVLIEQANTDEAKAAASATTIGRKLQEARYAVGLEKRLSKNEILERYLNIAYFGDGVYGIGTAATHYFGVPVEKLSLPQAALLAGIVKSPVAYDPTRNPLDSTTRRNIVLARMRDVGVISEPQRAEAAATPLVLDVQASGNGCATSFAPFFCDYILTEAQNDPAFGATAGERRTRLFQGGLTIRTTLDPKAQAAAQNAVDTVIPPGNVATASISVQPGTGQVKALAVNRTYGSGKDQTTVNYATGKGGSGFQAGSTFKMFTLVEALRQGLPTSLAFNAPNLLPTPPGCDGPPGGYSNADVRESGVFDMRKATQDSVNTWFVPLSKRLGILKVARTAGLLGVPGIDAAINAPRSDPARITEKSCAFTLGTLEVAPIDMAVAYATLAAHGLRCRPVAILEVTTAAGKSLPLPAPDCQQVIEPGIADTVTDLLTSVITNGTARNAAIGRPAAGKTGTTEDFAAAWFVGYTPGLATAVWVGDPRGGTRHPLIGVPGGTGGQRVVYGGGLPAQVWASMMSGALKGSPAKSFAGADPQVANGDKVDVPWVRGLSPEAALDRLRQAGLVGVVADGRVFDAGVQQGEVASTSPGQGATVNPGTPITVNISNGLAPPPSPSPSADPVSASPTASPPAPPATQPPATKPAPKKPKGSTSPAPAG